VDLPTSLVRRNAQIKLANWEPDNLWLNPEY